MKCLQNEGAHGKSYKDVHTTRPFIILSELNSIFTEFKVMIEGRKEARKLLICNNSANTDCINDTIARVDYSNCVAWDHICAQWHSGKGFQDPLEVHVMHS